jgi:hypothetical protein
MYGLLVGWVSPSPVAGNRLPASNVLCPTAFCVHAGRREDVARRREPVSGAPENCVTGTVRLTRVNRRAKLHGSSWSGRGSGLELEERRRLAVGVRKGRSSARNKPLKQHNGTIVLVGDRSHRWE